MVIFMKGYVILDTEDLLTAIYAAWPAETQTFCNEMISPIECAK
jgi:hypothetical protein